MKKDGFARRWSTPFFAALFLLGAVFAFAGGEEKPSSEEPEKAKVVTVFGAFPGEEAARFEATIKPFEDRTGIDVQYEYSKEFETLIFVRVEGGDPPDVAALPQPGLMKNFAAKGALVPLWPKIISKIKKNYAPVWKELGSYEDTPYGVFHRVNVKSLVWYPKEAWEKAGYSIPKTWDELKALMEKMVKEGKVPWTIGVESGGATGWAATDWIEDIMLRTAGPEVYDQWVNHEIPFNDPRVKRAFELMGEIWLNPQYAYGGPTYILTTNFGNAPNVMFEEPPKALMHRQGNFIASFFPEKIRANLEEEVGVFGFPSIDPKWGTPVLGGGDQFVMFNDRPEVRAFMEYLATGESAEAWARSGGAIFPHKDQNMDAYSTPLERAQAELLLKAKVFRFDASDLMPAEVGAGTFWTGVVDYVSGVDLDSVLDAIEASWPKE